MQFIYMYVYILFNYYNKTSKALIKAVMNRPPGATRPSLVHSWVNPRCLYSLRPCRTVHREVKINSFLSHPTKSHYVKRAWSFIISFLTGWLIIRQTLAVTWETFFTSDSDVQNVQSISGGKEEKKKIYSFNQSQRDTRVLKESKRKPHPGARLWLLGCCSCLTARRSWV